LSQFLLQQVLRAWTARGPEAFVKLLAAVDQRPTPDEGHTCQQPAWEVCMGHAMFLRAVLPMRTTWVR